MAMKDWDEKIAADFADEYNSSPILKDINSRLTAMEIAAAKPHERLEALEKRHEELRAIAAMLAAGDLARKPE